MGWPGASVPANLPVGKPRVDGGRMQTSLRHLGSPPVPSNPSAPLAQVLDRMSAGRFTCEFKYDGERAQIHKLQDGTIKVRKDACVLGWREMRLVLACAVVLQGLRSCARDGAPQGAGTSSHKRVGSGLRVAAAPRWAAESRLFIRSSLAIRRT
jgi:hypothetical protein